MVCKGKGLGACVRVRVSGRHAGRARSRHLRVPLRNRPGLTAPGLTQTGTLSHPPSLPNTPLTRIYGLKHEIMVRISEDLLRRRAVTGSPQGGTLAQARELALHGLGLERIEYLGSRCRKLQILLLQNNIIPRIENLQLLKVKLLAFWDLPCFGACRAGRRPRRRTAAPPGHPSTLPSARL